MDFFYVLDEKVDLLVADDDPIQREFALVYLAGPRTNIAVAEDGLVALRTLAKSSFDVLLLDLDMPNLNGYETLERLRANPETADLSVIVITGREDTESIDRAFALGATSFVTKPVNWRLLAYQIKFVLRAARQTSRRPVDLGLSAK